MLLLTIDDAKELFMQYDGSLFSLYRDDAQMYARFQELVTEDVQQKWIMELIERHFARLHDDPANRWIHHRSIVGLLKQVRGDIRAQVDRLLDDVAVMPRDPLQVILTMERMAGTTESQQDGGCYLIATRTHAVGKMKQVMLPYLAFSCEGEFAKRLVQAKRDYVQAEYRFCHDDH